MAAILSFVDWLNRFTDEEYALLRHRMRGVQFAGPNILRRWDMMVAQNWVDLDDPIVPEFIATLARDGIISASRSAVIFSLDGTSPNPPSGGGSSGGVDAILASAVENLPGGGGGGPLVVTDDFNRADGPLGSNWSHSLDLRFPMPLISANQMIGSGDAGSGGNGVAYWNPKVDAFPADQYVEATVVSGGDGGPVVRHQLDTPETAGDSTLSYYMLRINATSGAPASADLFRIDRAGFAYLGTFNAVASLTWRLEVRESTFTAYANGALATGTFTDDTYHAGQPGMHTGGFTLVDNWSAGAI